MKSILQPRVRDFVAWQLEHYQTNRAQLESIKRDLIPSPTPNYGGSEGHSTEAHRTTEDITIQISSSAYIRQLEQTVAAIRYVVDRLDMTDLQLVPGKPKNTGVGNLSLLQGNFPTQELNWSLN